MLEVKGIFVALGQGITVRSYLQAILLDFLDMIALLGVIKGDSQVTQYLEEIHQDYQDVFLAKAVVFLSSVGYLKAILLDFRNMIAD